MAEDYNPPQDPSFDQTTDYGRHFRGTKKLVTGDDSYTEARKRSGSLPPAVSRSIIQESGEEI